MLTPKRLAMNPRPVLALVISLLMLSIAGALYVNKVVKESCIATLRDNADVFALQVETMIESNKEQLQTATGILGKQSGNLVNFSIANLPNIPQDESFSRYTLLFPDNTLLIFAKDGYQQKPATYDFNTESHKVPYLSEVIISTRNNKKLIYQALPIKHNDKTIAIMYGVTELSKLPELFPNLLYNGEAKLFIIDGASGEIVMNTFNDRLFNIFTDEYPAKPAVDTETRKKWFEIVRSGSSGYSQFQDSATKESFYAYITPTKVDKWRAVIIAPESAVFARAIQVNNIFLILAVMNTILVIGFAIHFISNLRKKMEVNTKELRIMSTVDKITQLLNRNAYEERLHLCANKYEANLCVIYIDANGLRQLNNTIGHSAGDALLQTIGKNIIEFFGREHSYRIGGDEFIIFCHNANINDVKSKLSQLQAQLKQQDYSISIGTAFSNESKPLKQIIQEAEATMYEAKREYYTTQENVDNLRSMNVKLEKILRDKQDAETFLHAIIPSYLGAHIVDLEDDSQRPLYKPDYFAELYKKADNSFHKTLLLYADEKLDKNNAKSFCSFTDYNNLRKEFLTKGSVTLLYQRIGGEKLLLHVYKSPTYTEALQETLWIFERA